MSLITTWAPQYAAFGNPYEWGSFSIDVDRFARMIRGELRPEASAIITKPTARDVQRLAREFRTSGLAVAVDIETAPEHPDRGWTGKDPTRAELKTIGLGNINWGLSLHWRTASIALRRAVRSLLSDSKILKVLHNGRWFDERVLSRYRIVVSNSVDTRDARRAVSCTSRLSLAHCASLYDDAPPWKEGEEDDSKGLVFTDDLEVLKRYNAQDCVETARTWEGIEEEEEWNTPRVRRLYEVHSKLAVIAAEMHTTGFLVDKQKRAKLARDLEQEYYAAERKFLRKVGIKNFRCTPNDMRALIYRRHETSSIRRFSLPDPIDPAMYSNEEQTNCSVGEDALLLLLIDPTTPQELRELIDLYWAAESIWKKRSTFVTSDLVQQAIGHDGRIRAGWNTCGTETMRWSCSEPNLMNVEQALRVMYRASKGHVLVHADKSQLELNVMKAISRDDTLARNLLAGDVYVEDAKDWFRLPPHMTKCNCETKVCERPADHVKGGVRKSSKIIHLGAQYAAGTDAIFTQGLSQDRNLKYQTCATLHASFKKTYHRTVSYWFEEQARVRAQGYSEGRILQGRRVYPRDPPITEIANFPVQRTAGEMMNLETIELHAALKEHVPSAKLVAQLHDALDVDVPRRHRGEVERIMQDVLGTREYEIEGQKHTFPIDIKVGIYWSEV